MNTNATRLVTLAAASEILLLVDPTRIASVSAADASPDGALPEVIVTAHQARR
jgi:hypothetical protein